MARGQGRFKGGDCYPAAAARARPRVEPEGLGRLGGAVTGSQLDLQRDDI